MCNKILLTLVLSAVFGVAQATTVLYRDFNQLVDKSDHTMGGTITSIDFTQANNGEVYTVLSFDSAYTVEANGMRTLARPAKIRFWGGKIESYDASGNVDGYEMLEIAGTPEFNVGESVFMFVKDNGKSEMPIYGFAQGLYRVDNNQRLSNAKGYVIAGYSGSEKADVVTIKEGQRVVKGKLLGPAPAGDGMLLSELIEKVQQRKAWGQRQGKTMVMTDTTSLTKLPALPSAKSQADVPSSSVTLIEKSPAPKSVENDLK